MKEGLAREAPTLVRASAGLGGHVMVVVATRLIPTPSLSAADAVFEESASVEWQGIVMVEGKLVGECVGRNLEDALERLHSAITPSAVPLAKTGTG